jgi:hypothetical protein
VEVVIDGKRFLVGWKHDLEARVTLCIITLVQPDGISAACFAASSRVHPSDQYVKELGRRHSLKAALAKLWPTNEADWKPEDWAKAKARARECRTAIWKAYWDRKKRKEA